MSGSRSVRLAVVSAAFALFAGCSLIAEFDESKIPSEGAVATGGAFSSGGVFSSGGAGGTNTGGGGVFTGGSGGMVVPPDSSVGGAGGIGAGGDASGGEGGSGGEGPSPACDVETNEGCAEDEICCELGADVTCRKTSLDECEACGTPCTANLAVACVGRRCECAPGAGRACEGSGSERFCAGSPAACVECRDATDCEGRTDGKGRCVNGACVECDPANHAGCSGNEPICDASTLECKACSASPDDCPGALVCTASGACGNCATFADCTAPTAPICDATTTQCRACTSNAECMAGPKRPYCIQTICSVCSPAGDLGCNDPTKPDCRGALGGGYACQQCTSNAHCTGRAGTPVCDADTGRCVPCVDDNDCSANPKAPFCENNTCVSCEVSPALADLRCALKAGGEPVCIRSGTQKGECGACDPGGSRGCTANQLCCESSGVAACTGNTFLQCTACAGGACNPLLADNCAGRGCRCGSSAACLGSGDSRFCLGSPGACRECRNDGDCTNAGAPLCEGNVCVPCAQAASANARCAAEAAGTVCATAGTLAGRCAACDPATNAGCGGTLDQCSPATATCVDCVDDGGCSGTLNQCNVAARVCVDCVNDEGCSGTLDQCNVTSRTCIDCDATGGCASVATQPVCDAGSCRACAADAECVASPDALGPLCASTGACVPDSPCTGNSGCADANHPVCAGLLADGGGSGFCRRCDPTTGAGCLPSQACTAQFECMR